MSLIDRCHGLLRRRPPARKRLPADERRPLLPVAHDPLEAVRPTGIDLPAVVGGHLGDEPPVVHAPPRPAPAVLAPLDRHATGGYEPGRCRACSDPLAAGAHRPVCAVCRSLGVA